ncbi:hypothetical protein ACWGH4_08870 [Streptomyces sp. NPDC054847]
MTDAPSPQPDPEAATEPEPEPEPERGPAPAEPAAEPAVPPMPTAAPAVGNPDRARTLRHVLGGAAAGAALVGAIWAITANVPAGADAFTLEGTFTLTDGVGSVGDNCRGTGGYDDIGSGTSVTVYDAAGTTIATGSLGSSEYEMVAEGGILETCTFQVSVPDVPKGSRFYSVEISHRGRIQLTADEAQNAGFSGSLG